MADTTPKSNALNIALAIKLGDPPTTGADNGATASADGADFSSVQRNQALGFAYTSLAKRLIEIYGVPGVEYQCQGLITTQSCNFTGTITLNADCILPLRLVKSDGTTFKQLTKAELVSDDFYYINNAFTVEGGTLTAYSRSAGTLSALSTGTATLYYIKSDRKSTTSSADIAVNTSPDATVDVTWFNYLIDYAAYWLAMNKASGEWTEKAPTYLAQAESYFPKSE